MWVGEAGRPAHGPPAPVTVERYAGGGNLYRAYHHWLTFAAERMPTSATAWSNLAVALHALDHADAGDAVEHAVFLAPDDPDARLNRGSIRLARGDWPGAVADASHVVALEPDNADARELLEAARR
jgi:Flp pilus assembly protein TadD